MVPIAMRPLVPMHVAIGGKSLSAQVATKRPLARMHQHVPIQRRKRRKHLAAQTAKINFALTRRIVGIVMRLDLVVTANVSGEFFLR